MEAVEAAAPESSRSRHDDDVPHASACEAAANVSTPCMDEPPAQRDQQQQEGLAVDTTPLGQELPPLTEAQLAKLAQSDLRVDINAAKRAVHNALAGIDLLTRSTQERQQQQPNAVAATGSSGAGAVPPAAGLQTRSSVRTFTRSASALESSSVPLVHPWAGGRELRTHSNMLHRSNSSGSSSNSQGFRANRFGPPYTPVAQPLTLLPQQPFGNGTGFRHRTGPPVLSAGLQGQFPAVYGSLHDLAAGGVPTPDQLMMMQLTMNTPWQQQQQQQAGRAPPAQVHGASWMQSVLLQQQQQQAFMMMLQQQQQQQQQGMVQELSPAGSLSQQQQQQLLQTVLQQLQMPSAAAASNALPTQLSDANVPPVSNTASNASSAHIQPQGQAQQQQQQQQLLGGLFGLVSLYEEVTSNMSATLRAGTSTLRHPEQQLQGENSLLMAVLNLLLRSNHAGLSDTDCTADLGFIASSARRHMAAFGNISPAFRLATQVLLQIMFTMCPAHHPDAHQAARAVLDAFAAPAPELLSQIAIRWAPSLALTHEAPPADVASQLLVRLAQSSVKLQQALQARKSGAAEEASGLIGVGSMGEEMAELPDRLSPFSTLAFGSGGASVPDPGAPQPRRNDGHMDPADEELRRCFSAPDDAEALRSQRQLSGLWPHQTAISMPTTWECAEEGEDGPELNLPSHKVPHSQTSPRLAAAASSDLSSSLPSLLLPHELLQPSPSLPATGLYGLLPHSLSQTRHAPSDPGTGTDPGTAPSSTASQHQLLSDALQGLQLSGPPSGGAASLSPLARLDSSMLQIPPHSMGQGVGQGVGQGGAQHHSRPMFDPPLGLSSLMGLPSDALSGALGAGGPWAAQPTHTISQPHPQVALRPPQTLPTHPNLQVGQHGLFPGLVPHSSLAMSLLSHGVAQRGPITSPELQPAQTLLGPHAEAGPDTSGAVL